MSIQNITNGNKIYSIYGQSINTNRADTNEIYITSDSANAIVKLTQSGGQFFQINTGATNTLFQNNTKTLATLSNTEIAYGSGVNPNVSLGSTYLINGANSVGYDLNVPNFIFTGTVGIYQVCACFLYRSNKVFSNFRCGSSTSGATTYQISLFNANRGETLYESNVFGAGINSVNANLGTLGSIQDNDIIQVLVKKVVDGGTNVFVSGASCY